MIKKNLIFKNEFLYGKNYSMGHLVEVKGTEKHIMKH